jgi:hypothetical protein
MSPFLLVVLSTLGSPPLPACPAVPAQSPAALHCCTLASGQLCCAQMLAPDGTVAGCGCRP